MLKIKDNSWWRSRNRRSLKKIVHLRYITFSSLSGCLNQIQSHEKGENSCQQSTTDQSHIDICSWEKEESLRRDWHHSEANRWRTFGLQMSKLSFEYTHGCRSRGSKLQLLFLNCSPRGPVRSLWNSLEPWTPIHSGFPVYDVNSPTICWVILHTLFKQRTEMDDWGSDKKRRTTAREEDSCIWKLQKAL
jgi:hypothetical protein